jgi:hypothetical protein
VKITLRADSGFCRWRLMRWCDKHDVSYILGVAGNKILERRVAGLCTCSVVRWRIELMSSN